MPHRKPHRPGPNGERIPGKRGKRNFEAVAKMRHRERVSKKRAPRIDFSRKRTWRRDLCRAQHCWPKAKPRPPRAATPRLSREERERKFMLAAEALLSRG